MALFSDLIRLNLTEVQAGLRRRQFTAVELIQAYVDSMEAQGNLNAFITETPELALAAAKESDERLQQGTERILEGIPLAIKDLFCTAGVRTTAASRILENFTPAYDSTVSKKLFEAGGIMLGKANLDEFAMGSSNLTSYFGGVKNPWKSTAFPHKNLVPGGSSGGSAAAVAGGLALGATGTDTGGSIRQPAAFCGIVGLKPTYGLCSRYGVVAFASSLDQPGPMARTVGDTAILMQVMAGHDPLDSTSAHLPVPDYLAGITGDVRGLKVGIPKEYHMEGLDPQIELLWEQGRKWLKEAGAEIMEVSLPYTRYALPTYYMLAPAEASSNLARYDGVKFGLRVEGETLDDMYERTRAEGFGSEVKRRILIGTYVLSSGYYEDHYVKAQKVRTLIARDFEKVFKSVDVLLTPTAPTQAFAIGEEPKDPISMYLNDVFTVTANLAGIPGISVPCGISAHGLPLGLQLLGPAFSEGQLLNVASVLEESASFPLLTKSGV
jgi:aspartyl-tRNA(Asn)/glutamyl-tRNA(Gln) amidotransferase subunit A